MRCIVLGTMYTRAIDDLGTDEVADICPQRMKALQTFLP
jgi:hypothetical protein